MANPVEESHSAIAMFAISEFSICLDSLSNQVLLPSTVHSLVYNIIHYIIRTCHSPPRTSALQLSLNEDDSSSEHAGASSRSTVAPDPPASSSLCRPPFHQCSALLRYWLRITHLPGCHTTKQRNCSSLTAIPTAFYSSAWPRRQG